MGILTAGMIKYLLSSGQLSIKRKFNLKQRSVEKDVTGSSLDIHIATKVEAIHRIKKVINASINSLGHLTFFPQETVQNETLIFDRKNNYLMINAEESIAAKKTDHAIAAIMLNRYKYSIRGFTILPSLIDLKDKEIDLQFYIAYTGPEEGEKLYLGDKIGQLVFLDSNDTKITHGAIISPTFKKLRKKDGTISLHLKPGTLMLVPYEGKNINALLITRHAYTQIGLYVFPVVVEWKDKLYFVITSLASELNLTFESDKEEKLAHVIEFSRDTIADLKEFINQGLVEGSEKNLSKTGLQLHLREIYTAGTFPQPPKEKVIKLGPNEGAIGVIKEKVALPPNYTGLILPTSEAARMGVYVESLVHAGSSGNPRIIIRNFSAEPVTINVNKGILVNDGTYAPLCELRVFYSDPGESKTMYRQLVNDVCRITRSGKYLDVLDTTTSINNVYDIIREWINASEPAFIPFGYFSMAAKEFFKSTLQDENERKKFFAVIEKMEAPAEAKYLMASSLVLSEILRKAKELAGDDSRKEYIREEVVRILDKLSKVVRDEYLTREFIEIGRKLDVEKDNVPERILVGRLSKYINRAPYFFLLLPDVIDLAIATLKDFSKYYTRYREIKFIFRRFNADFFDLISNYNPVLSRIGPPRTSQSRKEEMQKRAQREIPPKPPNVSTEVYIAENVKGSTFGQILPLVLSGDIDDVTRWKIYIMLEFLSFLDRTIEYIYSRGGVTNIDHLSYDVWKRTILYPFIRALRKIQERMEEEFRMKSRDIGNVLDELSKWR